MSQSSGDKVNGGAFVIVLNFFLLIRFNSQDLFFFLSIYSSIQVLYYGGLHLELMSKGLFCISHMCFVPVHNPWPL